MKNNAPLPPPCPHPTEDNRQKQFERLYFEHVAALFQYGIKFRADQTLVEDCVQELFADLWENNVPENSIRSIRSYLLGALRRKILRKIYHEQHQPVLTDSDFVWGCRTAVAASSDGLSDEATAQVAAAVQQLTPKQREVIYLRFYNQLSFREIAEIMAVQTRTVYKLTNRALALLKETLLPGLPMAEVLLILSLL